MSELKPCPFCGGDASGIAEIDYGTQAVALGNGQVVQVETRETFFSVTCHRCDVAQMNPYAIREAAWAAWNTRPTEDRLVGALDEAERALEALVGTIRGECPRLLNEDSGGNASLSEQVDAALTRIRAAKGGE